MLLRTLGMAMLLIALFEPVLRRVRSEEKVAPIIIAVDESASMARSEALGQRSAIARTVLKAIVGRVGSAEVVTFSDKTAAVKDVDSVSFQGQRTDISQLVRTLSNRRGSDRPGVVLMITDGNSNTGEPAVYPAEHSGVGWYTIGIGDTVMPTDVSVQSVLASSICVVGKQTVVSASVSAHEVRGNSVIVDLLEEGRTVSSDTVSVESDHDQFMVHLNWTPVTAGNRKLSVRVRTDATEASLANNVLSEYVDVRTDERRIIVIAGAPSADVTFIKGELERNPSVRVDLYVQKQGADFYESPPNVSELAKAQSIVLIGFPLRSSPPDVIKRIADAASRGTSLLFVPSRETDYAKLKPLEEYLPFRVLSSRPTEFLATPDVKESATADPLLRVEGKASDAQSWNTLPPVFRTETFVMPTPGAEVLATMRVNNVPLAEPLIIRSSRGGTKSLAVLAYGLYRWKLMGVAPSAARGQSAPDVFAQFTANATAWLAVDDDDQRVQIRSTHQRYAAGEPVAFQGSVLDETFTAVDGASVVVEIVGPSGQQKLVLESAGGGRYSAVAGALPAGEYSYSATASVSGRGLGADAGRFSVGELGLEDAAIVQNSELLRAISERSGAAYGGPDHVDSVVQAALTDPRLRPRAVTTTRDQALWHLPWPLVVAIVGFSLEWIIRKRTGLV